MSYLFTSESVSEGHPDKVADAISDAILDLIMAKQDTALRCACETLVTTNRVVVAGEYKGVLDTKEVDAAIRAVIKNIGYEQAGFDWRTVEITNLLHGQSADIALGTDTFGAGDQGLMFGYACTETENYMPSAIYWSHKIVEGLTQARKNGLLKFLGPDAKSQVTFEYNDDSTPKRIAKVVCSTQHDADIDIENVRKSVGGFIHNMLPGKFVDADTDFYINPTGRFVVGGPDGDTGLTGRKIIVDTYGGSSPHGGGAFSGKDPTKVDRSAAYMARWLAKNVVADEMADWCNIQLSYAIGVKQPTSIYVDSNGHNRSIESFIRNEIDLSPKGIIDRFDLFNYNSYSNNCTYGHFGDKNVPWEQVGW
jgi:S-adenosylmethionine synthetase